MGQTYSTYIFKNFQSNWRNILTNTHLPSRDKYLTLYNTLILPHLSYCILVWGSKIQNNHPLLLLQKKTVRNIANVDYIAHSEPLCNH